MLSPLQKSHADRYLKRAGGETMQRAARFVRDVVRKNAKSVESIGARPGWDHPRHALTSEIHRTIDALSVCFSPMVIK